MLRRSFLLGTAALACGRGTAAARPAFVETRETVASLIEAWREKMPVVGLSVALVDRGELAWAAGFGDADRDARRPAAPETPYAIGSLTKLLTALATLRAIRAGSLALEDPIRRHLPELRTDGAEDITIRHLLCHRSGLISDWQRGAIAERPPDWRTLVREIAEEPLAAAPDTGFAYSNVGYTLLGHVLERSLGRSYRDQALAAASSVGATNLRFEPPAGLSPAHIAGHAVPEPRLRCEPAAGLYGTVLDLVPFLQWLLAGDGLAAWMLTPQPAGPLDFDERWGLGPALQHVGLRHAGRVAWHSGRTYGHRSVLIALPDRGLGIAVLANFREAAGVEDLAVSALQTALLERDGLDLPASRGDAEALPGAAVDAAALQRHAGRYANDFDVVTLDVDARGLVARSEIGKTLLTPAPEGGFYSADNRDALVRFRDHAGHHVLTSTVRGVESRMGVRCPEIPVPEDWLRRLGPYRAEVLPGEIVAFRTLHLELEGGGLQFRLAQPQAFAPSSTLSRYALTPIHAHEARVFGVGRGKGQRVLAEDGPHGPTLRWAGYHLVREA